MKNWLSLRGVLGAGVICLSAAVWAQDSESPNPLGDVARQNRAQHASAPADKFGNSICDAIIKSARYQELQSPFVRRTYPPADDPPEENDPR